MSNPDTASVWMYQDRAGKWCTFINEQHRLNTIESGDWVVREFHTVAPTEAAAMAATVPAGWKLVPIIPTGEMLTAADLDVGPKTANRTWAAMLKAAPQAPRPGTAPLSDEQIKEVGRSMLIRPWGIGSRVDTTVAFARLIEAAHGISHPTTPTPKD